MTHTTNDKLFIISYATLLSNVNRVESEHKADRRKILRRLNLIGSMDPSDEHTEEAKPVKEELVKLFNEHKSSILKSDFRFIPDLDEELYPVLKLVIIGLKELADSNFELFQVSTKGFTTLCYHVAEGTDKDELSKKITKKMRDKVVKSNDTNFDDFGTILNNLKNDVLPAITKDAGIDKGAGKLIDRVLNTAISKMGPLTKNKNGS